MSRIRIDDLPVAENLTPEQEALILGAGLKSFRPSLEVLEGREVPALIAPSIDLTGTTLTFQAGPRNYDHYTYGANVWINQDTNQVVAQRSSPTGTGPAVFLDRSQVTKIVYTGGLGRDTFRNNTNIQSEFTNLEQGKDVHTQGINSDRPPDTTFSLTSNYTNGRLPDSAADPEARSNGQSIGGVSKAPPLAWQGAPSNTQSYAVVTKHVTVPKSISDDGTFIHEVLYDIPKGTQSLSDFDPKTNQRVVPAGTMVGLPYQGANPPDGKEHFYVTTVYALTTNKLEVPAGATPEQMEAAIRAQSIGQTSIVGTFSADVRTGWNTETHAWNN